MRLTIDEITEAVNGGLIDSVASSKDAVTGMSWDSRTVKPGDLYIALPGERVDGHDFAEAAIAAGAVAVLATHPLDVDAPVVVVPDTQKALSQLAAYWRDHLQGTVVGLTGSTGKTTTKNLVRDVLSVAGDVVATKANQNNELGVPATLLAAAPQTHAVVVEMGMRGLNQISELCLAARPDWGLVTNVGESHIELLGSRENIARAKGELLAALPRTGLAFVNAADEYTTDLIHFGRLKKHGVKAVYFEGGNEHAYADLLGIYENGAPFVWADDVVLDAEGRPSFTMVAENFEAIDKPQANGQCQCTMELRGIHNVSNACSAAAVGLAMGLTLEQCCQALAQSQPEQGRQRVLRTQSGITVVDDAYNANPDSMAASLATFAALDVPGRRVAVLGDMGELGSFAKECHERVGALAGRSHLDVLICAGELSEHIARAALGAGMPEDSVRHADTTDAALADLKALLKPGDAVLVKASHFMGFDRIVEGLVD